jgi:predicted NBD/HSP70 family sugar kinase
VSWNSRSASAVLAVDVGSTDCTAALVDDIGTLRCAVRIPTPFDGGRTAGAVVTRSGGLGKELLGSHPDVHLLAAGLLESWHRRGRKAALVSSRRAGAEATTR